MKHSSLYKILFEGKEESEIEGIAKRAQELSIKRDDTVIEGITVNIIEIDDKEDKSIIHYEVLINGKRFRGNKKYFSINKGTGEVYSGNSREEINKIVPINDSIEKAIAHTLKNVIQLGYFMI